jgi:hypothetical protein
MTAFNFDPIYLRTERMSQAYTTARYTEEAFPEVAILQTMETATVTPTPGIEIHAVELLIIKLLS